MPKPMKFRVVIEKDEDEGGWVAHCVEIPGAISQGETLAEVQANIADAISEIVAYRKEEAKKLIASSHVKGTRLKTVEVSA